MENCIFVSIKGEPERKGTMVQRCVLFSKIFFLKEIRNEGTYFGFIFNPKEVGTTNDE